MFPTPGLRVGGTQISHTVSLLIWWRYFQISFQESKGAIIFSHSYMYIKCVNCKIFGNVNTTCKLKIFSLISFFKWSTVQYVHCTCRYAESERSSSSDQNSCEKKGESDNKTRNNDTTAGMKSLVDFPFTINLALTYHLSVNVTIILYLVELSQWCFNYKQDAICWHKICTAWVSTKTKRLHGNNYCK